MAGRFECEISRACQRRQCFSRRGRPVRLGAGLVDRPVCQVLGGRLDPAAAGRPSSSGSRRRRPELSTASSRRVTIVAFDASMTTTRTGDTLPRRCPGGDPGRRSTASQPAGTTGRARAGRSARADSVDCCGCSTQRRPRAGAVAMSGQDVPDRRQVGVDGSAAAAISSLTDSDASSPPPRSPRRACAAAGPGPSNT